MTTAGLAETQMHSRMMHVFPHWRLDELKSECVAFWDVTLQRPNSCFSFFLSEVAQQ